MDKNFLPIGVFDSGIGGLTVVRELVNRLPQEDILYLGDTARVPYGTKSPDTVVKYARGCSDFLLRKGIKLLVVACNTASSYALNELQEDLPVPVVGVISAGVRKALSISKSGHVGVIGTRGTIKSGSYDKALQLIDGNTKVTGFACPLFVPLAEEGITEGAIAQMIADEYMGHLAERDKDIDTIILGCTHYPLLERVIKKAADKAFNKEIILVNSASAVAEDVETKLKNDRIMNNGNSGSLKCYITDDSRAAELAELFLGKQLSSCEKVDIS